MRRSPRQRIFYLLSFLFAAIPFAFGVIRAVETGSDLRYLWLAIASFIAATAVVAIGRARREQPNVPIVLAAAVFIVTTLVAALTAYMLGARAAAGIWMVSVAYALCSAASYALDTLSRPRTE